MNEYEGFRNYRSPFAAWERQVISPSNNHWQWWHWRDEFERFGGDVYLKMMLDNVTMDNPPLASEEPEISNREIWLGLLNLLPYFLILITGIFVGLIA